MIHSLKKESPAQLIHCEHGHGRTVSAFMMVLSHIAGEYCDPWIWLPFLQHGSGVTIFMEANEIHRSFFQPMYPNRYDL